MKHFDRSEAIGFIGLGVMGSEMARWLIEKGWRLVIYSRRDEPAQQLGSCGARSAPTPADVGRDCRLVLLCVSDDVAVEQVIFGPLGLAQGLRTGSAIVDMSTIASGSARRFAGLLETLDVSYLDAPVSGGQPGAVAGTLACMVGGPLSIVDAVREPLAAFCKSVTHAGAVGSGQTVKACNQVAAAAALLGVADAIALALSQGVDARLMRQVLLQGTARSLVLERDGERIIEGAFNPGFKARLMRKDLQIALAMAEDHARLQSTPIAASLLEHLCAAGDAEVDWSAIGRYAQRPGTL